MSEKTLSGERIDLGNSSSAWWPCHVGKNTTIGKIATLVQWHILAEIASLAIMLEYKVEPMLLI